MWLPEGVHQKSCNHCTVQSIVCTVDGIQVSNQKQRDRLGAVGSWPKKRSQVEVGSDVESVKSGTRGWRQEVPSALVGISGLLREQNGCLMRIAQGLDVGLGASVEDHDSTMRE